MPGFGGSGGRDWGGRRKINPDNAPKVTRKMVLDKAAKLSIQVRRDSYAGSNGTWWYFDEKEDRWLTLAETNYRAILHLERLMEE